MTAWKRREVIGNATLYRSTNLSGETSMDNKLPLGLRKPWQWVQPHGDDELLARLRDGFMLAVHERERENLCSVAHVRIKEMREEIAFLERFADAPDMKTGNTTRDELRETIANMKRDRDHAWDAFQRLRRAYSMIRYPTLTQEIKLLYDQADLQRAMELQKVVPDEQ